MSFAVQLYFDPGSDTAIRNLWEAVASAGVPFPLRDSGNRPHVSLAIYGEIDVPVCASRLNVFAQTRSPFALSIASLGIFSAEKTVVFLAPIVSPTLLDLHRQVHQLLQDAASLPAAHYLPGHWTPHCTLATRVPPQCLSQAVGIGLGISFPFSLSIEEIGIIEYPPVTPLFSFPLTGA
jgi:2'-5' RNA ligase